MYFSPRIRFKRSPRVTIENPELSTLLFDVGIPSDLCGMDILPCDLDLVDIDGLSYVRIGTVGSIALIVCPRTNRLIQLREDLPLLPVNSTIFHFSVCVDAVNLAYPFYPALADDGQVGEVTEYVERLLTAIDPGFTLTNNAIWQDIFGDLSMGHLAG